MANHLRKELSEEHSRIVSECNKICHYLCLMYSKSENILCKSVDMKDDEVLLHYSNVYKYLSSLHLQLIDMSCKFQLFFNDIDKTEKDIPKELVCSDSGELPNFTISDFLNIKRNFTMTSSNILSSKPISNDDCVNASVNIPNYGFKPISNPECLKPMMFDGSKNQPISPINRDSPNGITEHKFPKQLIGNKNVNYSTPNNKTMEGSTPRVVTRNVLQPIQSVNNKKTNEFTSNDSFNTHNNFGFDRNILGSIPNLQYNPVEMKDLEMVTDTLLNMIPVMNRTYNSNQSFNSANTSMFPNYNSTGADISDFTMKSDDIKESTKNGDLILFSSSSTNSTVSDNSRMRDNKISEINKILQGNDISENINRFGVNKHGLGENPKKEGNKPKKTLITNPRFKHNVNDKKKTIEDESRRVDNEMSRAFSNQTNLDEPESLDDLVTDNFDTKKHIEMIRSKTDAVENIPSEANNKSSYSQNDKTESKRLLEPNTEPTIKTSLSDVLKNIMKESDIRNLSDPIEGEICLIAHVESPSSIYIHVDREETSRLDVLPFDIEETIDHLPYYTNKREAMFAIKHECVCFDENHQHWCRAYVIDWKIDNEDYVICYLMDYGEIINMAVTNIRKMVEILYSIPHLVIPCKLAFLIPSNEGDKWSKGSVKYIMERLKSKECVKISFVERNDDGLHIDLKLADTESIVGEIILKRLARSILSEVEEFINGLENKTEPLCSFMKEQIKFSQGFTSEESMDEEAMFDNACDVEEQEANMYDNPVVAVSHYEAQDEKRVCRFLSAGGGCWKGDECRFSHEPLMADGWTRDQQEVYHSALNKLILPSAGVTASVLIASITDLTTLYVRIKSYPDMYKPKYQPVSTLHALIKMMNKSEEIRKMPPMKVMPADGEIVLVKYEDQWQRGKVLDQSVDRCDKIIFEILLVDFGLIVTAEMKELRVINSKFLVLPFQAVLCYLANVKRKLNITDEIYHNGRDFLEAKVLNKTLQAKICYSGNHLKFLLKDEQGYDIGEQLIELGYVNRLSDYLTNEKEGRLMLVE